MLEAGQRFTIRDGVTTVATGVVTKVLPNMTPEEEVKMLKGKTKKEKEAFLARIAEIEAQYS